MTDFHSITLAIVLFPLLGCLLAGLWGQGIGQRGAHIVTIGGVAISFILSCYLAYQILFGGLAPFNFNAYTWGISGSFQFNVGFLVDRLTAVMLVIVNFVSLAVHIYSVGYMRGDSGYQRFFSYISLFTFAMLMLVAANNFLQLYFGWEGVGLASYLLIGFWFKRESAIFGSLKAFIVNRIGDFGFLLGIGSIFNYFDTLDYATVFHMAPTFSHTTMVLIPGVHWSVITVICILLFIGAMGKSAQMPLHVWLPESMEGPTPISALIHAATMVTAGVYMLARMSPLFEYSPVALSVVIVIGATGALFMGLLAIVQNDIKRIIAYSTLSQLGYMVVAIGASAYAAGIFHLLTHACFKALLFLAAGSVILAMHHEQDIRQMGNLRKYMPITYVSFFIGAWALAALPPFAGFYSKEAIISAAHLAKIPGAEYAYYCVLLGTFVTAFYIFRAFFLVFHTQERMPENIRADLQESPWVVWVPLVALAIPSVVVGALLVGPILFDSSSLLGNSIFVLPQNNVLAELALEYKGPIAAVTHAIFSLPFWLAAAGFISAWIFYVKLPGLPAYFAQRFSLLYSILIRKYGFDDFNQIVFVRGGQKMAHEFFVGDVKILDYFFVDGSGRLIAWCSRVLRKLQSGYLYHYAFAMIFGLLGFLVWLLFF